MKLFCPLLLFTTAECSLLASLLGTVRHHGLEPSAGFLSPKDCDKFDASTKVKVLPVIQEELPLKQAELMDIAPGRNASLSSAVLLADLVEQNVTQPLEEKLAKDGFQLKPEPPAPKSRPRRSVEGNLIESLKSMGATGDEAVHCVTDCRYGDIRHGWADCLNNCVENPLMRSTFMSMLPKDNHEAHAEHVEMPDVLKKRQQRRRDRSGEL